MYNEKSRTCPTCNIVVYPDEVGCGCGWVPPPAPRGGKAKRPGKHLGISAMRRTVTGVTVEYNEEYSPAPGFPPETVRVTKTFPKDGQARAFYAKMVKEGRNPKIVSASINGH